MDKKGLLIILDGYGEGKANAYNAVANAKTPFLHGLKKYPYAMIKTDGESVGLFKGKMGGSEVGHLTIGSGRVEKSIPCKIMHDIESHEFENNPKFKSTLKYLQSNNGDLHLFGLMSDKYIHSSIDHLYRIIELAKDYANHIYIHFVADGRDCGVHDSLKYLSKLEQVMAKTGKCEIASVAGRFYAMDRENNMDRTQLSFNAMFNPTNFSNSAKDYICSQHKKGITDEFIVPTSIKTKQTYSITKNDVIFIFNFRQDRMRQIGKLINDLPAKIVTMAKVATIKSAILYPEKIIKHGLSEYLSKQNKRQIKISETTKYAHVTYFFNGGEEKPFPNEDRVHIPTYKVSNYAKKPAMRAKEITNQVLKAIAGQYDAIIVNYSNPDMIGHTGDYKATLKALKAVDRCVKKVVKMAIKNNYFALVTADHGNSEQMRQKSGEPCTSHTTNPVICALIDKCPHKLKKHGDLSNIAPTMIDLMGLKPNPYFTGKSLLQD